MVEDHLKTYRELTRFETFEERYAYLRLFGGVGRATFGFDRYINQEFYKSFEWRRVREQVIIRDNGCDLGIEGFEIHSNLLVHHMNPILVNDIVHGEEFITDPQYLITTTHKTHNAIHYGVEDVLLTPLTQRTPGDTKLW